MAAKNLPAEHLPGFRFESYKKARGFLFSFFQQKQFVFTLLSGLLLLLNGKSVNGQITLLRDYKNNYSASIGTFQGINFREAGFSGLYPVAGSNGKEFWTVSDRGANIDAANANPSACRPTYDKIYSFPGYAPKIHRIKLNGDSIQILQTISIKKPNGTNTTGLLNPTGFGSTAAEVVSTDTVLNCDNFNAKTAAKDIWGIDSEGILVDADGNFWICEEGGPTIWKLSPNGVVLQRYTPYANLAGAQPQDIMIDTVFKYRKNNRGFEGIAISPRGKIYAFIQSPLLYPNKSTGEGTRIHRILEINPANNSTRILAYLNDGSIGTGADQIRLRDWKIGDMAAVNDSMFLVIEAAARGTSDIKRIYLINISKATAVNSGLYNGSTLEALADSSGLASNGIVPVTKTLFLDLLANGWPAELDKAEGLAILNDSTVLVGNDNDYGQASPAENGIGTATGKVSNVIVYGLQGDNKLPGYHTPLLDSGITSHTSSQSPYLLPVQPGVRYTSIITANDSVGGYKMSGTPDGLGAFDNGNGTFTLLMDHEFVPSVGVVRAHGSMGSFVSKWIINKSDLSVVSGSDLIQKVRLWNPFTNTYTGDTTTAFGRFCSADLPAVSAFYNSNSGKGTQERIFMDGEETGAEGRAFGHIVTGANAGLSYELPYLGKFSWENSVANPTSGDKTIVAGMDDTSPMGQVYMYVGTKTSSGSEVDKAGLSNGKLFGVSVAGLISETNDSVPAAGTRFSLFDLGDVHNTTGAVIDAASIANGVTGFLRPEDGAWDPSNPRDFYFATTNSFTSPSRLWKLHFDDVVNPETGGTIEAVLDGTEGQKMLDNITIDHYGHIIMVEDVGNNAHLGKIWQYTIATDELIQLGQHDPARFLVGGSKFLTQDEEASGVVDVQNILGPGMFLLDVQAHYTEGVPADIVEGGQLLAMFNPDTKNAFDSLGQQSITSSQSPYLLPVQPGVKYTSIITANDSVGGYKMSGTPDGLGAFDNGNGTFTLLMDHEFVPSVGVVRAHGSMGSFVSKWIINKSDLSVVSGSDLIQKVRLWNPFTNTYTGDTTTAFGRFCSADLPAVSAFYNSNSGKGTQERIFMDGEETGAEGRAFGHIVTGANAGLSYELPYLGKFSWENSVANPTAGDKTIVAGMDDTSPMGQVYMYVGTKTSSGSEVDKAGLSNGKLFGVSVAGLISETNDSVPAAGTRFSLFDLGDVHNTTGAVIDAASIANGVTGFLRPEDGAWDPSNPRDFYFATTNSFTSPSRLWRLHFDDVVNPETGGTIEAVLDGTEGQKMLDNITIDHYGHIIMVEDVGNNAHLGKIWQYTIATDQLIQLGQHDPARFLVGGSKFLTQDEEASGVVDVQNILGPGMFLLDVQAHYTEGVPADIVEGGQLLAMFNPGSAGLTPPFVHLTTPLNNATYLSGGNVYLKAMASDEDGTISKVEFYNGATLLYTATDTPYAFKWPHVAKGSYTLTAKATDNNGLVTVSAPVHIFVVPNTPPAVSIIAPSNLQVFTAPATINLEAAAYDIDGRIVQVSFYNGTALLTNSEHKVPYTYQWHDVPAGIYTITAVAKDNWSDETTSVPITVIVTDQGKSLANSRASSAGTTTGIDSEPGMQLLPNPVRNTLTINTKGLQKNRQSTISVLSLSGVTLQNKQLTGSVQTTRLNVSSLPKGVYIIRFISGDKVMYKQFVKL